MTDPDPPVVVHLVHQYSPVYHIAGHPMIDHEGTLAFATADEAQAYADAHGLDPDPVVVEGAIHWSADELQAISQGLQGLEKLLSGVDARTAAQYRALAAKAAAAAFLEVTRDA